MALNFQFDDEAFIASEEGIFIPVSDLPGIVTAELDPTEAQQLSESKIAYSLCNAIFNSPISGETPLLGLSATKGVPDGIDNDTFTQSFTFTWQKMVNTVDNVITQIPLATSGVNNGAGKLSIVDVFANAVKVDKDDITSGAGILIPSSAVSSYSTITHADITVSSSADNREWFAALFDFLTLQSVRRTTATPSAIITANASAISASAIPSNFTLDGDSFSGILPSERPVRGLINRTLTLTVELLLNQTTQTFEVNAI